MAMGTLTVALCDEAADLLGREKSTRRSPLRSPPVGSQWNEQRIPLAPTAEALPPRGIRRGAPVDPAEHLSDKRDEHDAAEKKKLVAVELKAGVQPENRGRRRQSPPAIPLR